MSTRRKILKAAGAISSFDLAGLTGTNSQIDSNSTFGGHSVGSIFSWNTRGIADQDKASNREKWWYSADPVIHRDHRIACDGGVVNDDDDNSGITDESGNKTLDQMEEIRDMLNFLTQETRFLIIINILAHPEQAPSLKELDHHIEGKSMSTINNHLQRLIEEGIVKKIKLRSSDRSRNHPSTFYQLSEDGREFIQRHGIVPISEDELQRQYMTVEKTPEIRRYEDAPRPDEASERPGAPTAFDELVKQAGDEEQDLIPSSEEDSQSLDENEENFSLVGISDILTTVANEIESRSSRESNDQTNEQPNEESDNSNSISVR